MKEEQKNGKNSKRSEQTAAKAGTEGLAFRKKCRTAHPACSTASGDWIRFSGVWFYELSAWRFRLA